MDTKQHILDVAERLLAENGISATSLRMITSEAGVNLASVNYYYGSKDTLVQEVFRRRIKEVNEERMRLLRRYQEEAGGGPLALEKIMEALIGPMVRLCISNMDKGYNMAGLMHRLFTEPNEALMRFILDELREIITIFTGALAGVLPGASPQEIHWRLNFSIGAAAHALLVVPRLMRIVPPEERTRVVYDEKTVLFHLIPFISGGFRTPTSAVPP
jgi:AcrR family transcriptional regulator